jgi:tetratricopeptide (TPR) repeat protein
MRHKIAGTAVMALSLLAASGFAQSAAELLQKGIYNQDTVGNLDAAIQMYRQVVNTSNDRALAAEAQYFLAQALLRKGDLSQAAQEFQKLATNFADFRELVMKASGRVHSFQPPAPPLGTVQNLRYHHIATNVEFSLPAGWSVDGTVPSSDDGEMVDLSDQVSKVPFAAVWLKPDPIPAATVGDSLRGAIPQKISQRRGYKNYQIRPESVHSRTVGGKQALSAVADYEEDGKKMAESLTWVITENTRTFFFARMPATDLPSFQPRFDQLISSALVP